MYSALHEFMYYHAVQSWPKESCGIVIANSYCPIRNVALQNNEFQMHPADIGDTNHIQALIHSHTNGQNYPSKQDLINQKTWGVPWGIISISPEDRNLFGDIFFFGDESAMLPLIGRPFRHGVTDCWSCVRDWFRLEYPSIAKTLDSTPREWEWWKNGESLLNNFREYGFSEINPDNATYGDVVLMKIKSKVPNHCGIIIEDQQLLHHPGGSAGGYSPNELSRREPLWRYKDHITHYLRHNMSNLLVTPKPKISVSFNDNKAAN